VPLKIFDFKTDKAWLDNIALVTQLGLTMAGSILFCFAIGYFLDKWLGTKGLFIVIFLLLGIAGGGYTAYRQIMQATKESEKKKG
jgi:ATP synthase protein I